jgi:hypothetical protein
MPLPEPWDAKLKRFSVSFVPCGKIHCMSKKNGDNGNIVYKEGKAYLNGKLIGIGFKEGEHIPRASDYKLPKRLSKLDKELIETSQAVLEGFRKARENAAKNKRKTPAS